MTEQTVASEVNLTSKEDMRAARKLASVSAVAASIEYFDFFLYGLASALIFPALFFPDSSPLMGLLMSFGVFGVGFVARPLGGAIFGHFGDKYGRKKALVVALTGMGIATTLVGALPTYATLGIAAPIILVLLRLIQGVAMGGQMGGVVLLATESAPAEHRGFFGSLSSLGAPGGTLLANLAFLAVTVSLPEEQLMAWGWRLPFFASILLVIMAIYIHAKLEDTVAFQRLQQQKLDAAAGTAAAPSISKAPLIEVLTKYPKQVLLAIGAYLGQNVAYYVMVTFVLSYGSNPEFLGLDRNVLLTAVLVGAAVQLAGIPFGGWLSDQIGRARTVALGTIMLGVFSFALWPMLHTGNTGVIMIALILGLGVAHAIVYGSQPAYFVEVFDTQVRYSGVSLGIQVAAVLGGGFAPLIATALVGNFGWMSVAIYMATTCLISVISIILLGETYKGKRAARKAV